MNRAFVFPGQGSQTIGMGKELAEAFSTARYIFEEVDETLKQNLSRIIFYGPDEQLRLTTNAQPALMAVSIAIVRVLQREGNISLIDLMSSVAGHSLGEYSALATTEALTLADTARLLKLRGEAMQIAVPVGEGAMAALIGATIEKTEDIITKTMESKEEGEVCELANDNAPGQVVISGSTSAIKRAAKIGEKCGVKRSIILPVSAPFHCSLMQPAAEAMAEALFETTILPPTIPIIANFTAKETRNPETIRNNLINQVTGRVRWRETILRIKQIGIDTLVEAGSGKILGGLTKRIDRELCSISIQNPKDIDSFLHSL